MQCVAAELEWRLGSLGTLMQPATVQLGPADLLQQGHGAVGGRQGDFERQALFKATAGVGPQPQAAGALADGLGSKHRRLEQDRCGLLLNSRRVTAHDTGQRNRVVRVAHDPGVFTEAVVAAIEGREGFARTASAEIDRRWVEAAFAQLGQSICIKGMQGLSLLQHHQVGDVHDVVDRPETSTLESALEPTGRGADLEAREGGQTEQAAVFDAVLNIGAHRQCLGADHRCCGGQVEGCPSQCSHLAGDAEHRETIGAVGGNRQLQDLIVETKEGANRAADGRNGLKGLLENNNSVRAIGQPEL